MEDPVMSAVKHWSGPTRNDWTVREYYRLGDLQAFREQRVELIEGVIVEKEQVTPQHAAGQELARRALERVFGPGFWIRFSGPLRGGRRSLPDPDIAVIPGGPRVLPAAPTTALLVVEVSDATISYDRRRRESLRQGRHCGLLDCESQPSAVGSVSPTDPRPESPIRVWLFVGEPVRAE